MNVVLLENEANQAANIKAAIEYRSGIRVEHISTEWEFCCSIEGFIASPPAAFILDLIVDWTEPGIDVAPPLEVRRDGPYLCGARCFGRLAAHPATRSVPVVFYTGCRRNDLDENIAANSHFLSKDYGDHRELRDLVLRLVSKAAAAGGSSSSL